MGLLGWDRPTSNFKSENEMTQRSIVDVGGSGWTHEEFEALAKKLEHVRRTMIAVRASVPMHDQLQLRQFCKFGEPSELLEFLFLLDYDYLDQLQEALNDV